MNLAAQLVAPHRASLKRSGNSLHRSVISSASLPSEMTALPAELPALHRELDSDKPFMALLVIKKKKCRPSALVPASRRLRSSPEAKASGCGSSARSGRNKASGTCNPNLFSLSSVQQVAPRRSNSGASRVLLASLRHFLGKLAVGNDCATGGGPLRHNL